MMGPGPMLMPLGEPIVAVAPAGAFSPSSVTGLALWLRADAGLYDATSGGSAVTSDGASVARWEDQSGNGRHVTQATGANRPLLKTAIVNAKPVLRFDGSNDSFSRSVTFTDLLGSGSDFTVFGVWKSPNTAQQTVFAMNSAGGRFGCHNPWVDGSIYLDGGDFTNNRLSVAAPSGYVGSWRVQTLRRSGVNMLIRDNGVDRATKSNASGTDSSSTTFYVGQLQGGFYWGGDLAELLIYNNGVGSTDQASLETYLNGIYAVY